MSSQPPATTKLRLDTARTGWLTSESRTASQSDVPTTTLMGTLTWTILTPSAQAGADR